MSSCLGLFDIIAPIAVFRILRCAVNPHISIRLMSDVDRGWELEIGDRPSDPDGLFAALWVGASLGWLSGGLRPTVP
jgi:hypothetical protein